jgi:hypothetical protein
MEKGSSSGSGEVENLPVEQKSKKGIDEEAGECKLRRFEMNETAVESVF